MELVVRLFDQLIAIARIALLWGAGILALVVALDWLVRTRRISPFSRVARLVRSLVDPLLLPVERQVVRAGGTPTNAPWWALAIVVIGGIVLVSALSYVRNLLWDLNVAAERGRSGILALIVAWTFGILQLALLVRVVASWIRISPYSPWVRWSYRLTEWMLRPLRQFIPPLGAMDITPIVAYILLQLCERALSATLI